MVTKKRITKDEELIFFASFQTSALLDTLDDMEETTEYIKTFKSKTLEYKTYLENKVMQLCDKIYENDPNGFEIIDRMITANSKEFSRKGLEEFFIIEDD